VSRYVVTGANGGIGEAISIAIAAAGHEVVGTDLRVGSYVMENATGDLTDPAQRAHLVETIASSDGIDGVVFAHGVEGTGDIRSLESDRLRRVMAVNFTAVIDTLSALAPHIRPDGVVVIIASQAGLRGEAASAAYCASKFALVGWFRQLDPRSLGLRLRLISPGAVDTALVRDAFAGMARAAGVNEATIERDRIRAVPAGRLGRPEEVAASVVYAISATARTLELTPTGGETLR
jgi:NAD(P)-dependent dehydrogenase (short-subunit alcohol dehydrogenase family)